MNRGGVISDGVLAGEEQTRDGLEEKETEHHFSEKMGTKMSRKKKITGATVPTFYMPTFKQEIPQPTFICISINYEICYFKIIEQGS